MSDPDPVAGNLRLGLTADTVATAVVIIWGLAYLFAAVLAPDLIGNVSRLLSAAAMAGVGLLLLWSVYHGSRVVFAGLALVQIGSMVASWTGTLQWAVPYDPGVAAVSMAAMDFLVAVALVYKTIQVADLDVDLPSDH